MSDLVQTGWKPGKEWDDAYEYLAGGAQLLGMLHRRFVVRSAEVEAVASP